MPDAVQLLDARIVQAPDDGSGGPRQQWIDISFTNAPVALSFISFRNYYCAAITISHTSMRAESDPSAPLHMKGRAPTWQSVVNRLPLMAAAHCEDDAQNYHELTTAHFAPEFDHRRVTRLRIVCLQPSPTWREYGLRDLRFYSIELPSVPSLQAPPSLSPDERELASTVTDHVIDLWSLAQEIRQTLAPVRAGRARRPAAGAGIGSAARLAAESYEPLAPYIVGEWADELRLLSVDAPMTSSQHSSSRYNSGASSYSSGGSSGGAKSDATKNGASGGVFDFCARPASNGAAGSSTASSQSFSMGHRPDRLGASSSRSSGVREAP